MKRFFPAAAPAKDVSEEESEVDAEATLTSSVLELWASGLMEATDPERWVFCSVMGSPYTSTIASKNFTKSCARLAWPLCSWKNKEEIALLVLPKNKKNWHLRKDFTSYSCRLWTDPAWAVCSRLKGPRWNRFRVKWSGGFVPLSLRPILE